MKHGNEGQWAVVSSNIKDVGSNQNNNGMRPNTKHYFLHHRDFGVRQPPPLQPLVHSVFYVMVPDW